MGQRSKIILGLMTALLIAGVTAAYGKASTITFTGKIQEIRKATALGLGKKDTFFLLKLDNQAKAEFRLSEDDAVRYGLIDQAGTSQILTPKQSKGLGWKVKLTCDNDPKGSINAPVYRVRSLERMDD